MASTRSLSYPAAKVSVNPKTHLLGCRPASWNDGRLDLVNLYTGEHRTIDWVARAVYATPRRANDALAAPLAAAGVEVHLIGDCFAPRNALAAMGEARATALAI